MTGNSSPAPYVASCTPGASPQAAWNAFDGTDGFNNSAYAPMPTPYFELDLGSGSANVLSSYAMKAVTVAPYNDLNRVPREWTLEGSNDDSAWTTLDTQSGQTGWSLGEVRNFQTTNTTAYRYYRINVTANNGDGSWCAIDELYFYAAATPYDGGVDGDLFLDTLGQVWYGPKNSSGSPIWPRIGKLS
ncbi:MAG: discoidin domain-containing protein [Tepidisphaeraceae bacterium]